MNTTRMQTFCIYCFFLTHFYGNVHNFLVEKSQDVGRIKHANKDKAQTSSICHHAVVPHVGHGLLCIIPPSGFSGCEVLMMQSTYKC